MTSNVHNFFLEIERRFYAHFLMKWSGATSGRMIHPASSQSIKALVSEQIEHLGLFSHRGKKDEPIITRPLTRLVIYSCDND